MKRANVGEYSHDTIHKPTTRAPNNEVIALGQIQRGSVNEETILKDNNRISIYEEGSKFRVIWLYRFNKIKKGLMEVGTV